ncbi:MAG: 16S rRNA (adenine1518-N6/adenine1519-N6)-dimethyltransferase [Myxococcota bacterium]|jgi:16S rRNA (adenine1518-N6/adenine1519-N6)-dimethyltransferase
MKADKRLGQHFLRDPGILAEIAAVADVGRSAGALEIGPGEGAMTAFLLRSDVPVVALEKDARAVIELRERFGDRLTVVAGDAVTDDLAALLPPIRDGRLPIVVGNLPFNVGSAIFRRLLDLRGQVARIVVMLQKEVADRIVATAGSRAYGIPSVMTAMLANAWIVVDVPPSAFSPRPKVDSSVVLVEFLTETPLEDDEMKGFAAFLRSVFQSRRKTLGRTFSDDANALQVLEDMAIDASLRVEQLPPTTLLALHRTLRELPQL